MLSDDLNPAAIALANRIKCEIFDEQASRHGRQAWDPDEVIAAIAEVGGYFVALAATSRAGTLDSRDRIRHLVDNAIARELPILSAPPAAVH